MPGMSSIASQLKRPESLALAVGLFAYAWVLYVVFAWLPTYLLTARQIKLADLSWAGSLPWVAGVVGSMVGGILDDWPMDRTSDPTAVRTWLLVAGLAMGSSGLAVVVMSGSLADAVTIFSLILFALYIAGPQVFPLSAAMVPARRYGGIAGALQGFAKNAGFFSPAIKGFLVQRACSWTLAFSMAGCLGMIGAMLPFAMERARMQAAAVS